MFKHVIVNIITTYAIIACRLYITNGYQKTFSIKLPVAHSSDVTMVASFLYSKQHHRVVTIVNCRRNYSPIAKVSKSFFLIFNIFYIRFVPFPCVYYTKE